MKYKDNLRKKAIIKRFIKETITDAKYVDDQGLLTSAIAQEE